MASKQMFSLKRELSLRWLSAGAKSWLRSLLVGRASEIWFLIMASWFVLEGHHSIRGMELVADAPQVLSLLGGFFALFFLLEFLRSTLRRRPNLFIGANVILVILYLAMGFYHHHTKQSFDFALISDNLQALRSGTVWADTGKMAGSMFQPQDYRFSFVVLLVFAFLWRWDRRDFLRMKTMPWSLALGLCLGMTGMNLFVFDYTTDEFSNFAASVRSRVVHRNNFIQRRHVKEIKEQYPLVRLVGLAGGGEKTPPNLLVVFVESFNGNFVEAQSPQGLEFTPVYNRLIKEGRYYENFFAAAVQTSDGQFAALCGLIPPFRGKGMIDDQNKNFLCGPEILRRQGYQTFFSHAYPFPDFDNTRGFLTSNGIEEMRIFSDCKGEDQKLCWGWGLADDVFFRRAVTYLDRNLKPDRPFLAVLSTISSHMTFEEVPVNFREINTNPRTRREHYENAIHYADAALEVLIKAVKASRFGKNTVILITGDHSFPMGEHGNFHNENQAYEENYRTPMLILDLRHPGKAERISGRYSQLGLPATLADLAGLQNLKAPFLMDSFYLPPPPMTFHIQPYAGVYLAVVRGDLKYIFWEARQKEFLYDLKADPLETTNLIDQYLGTETLRELRDGVGMIYWQQSMIRADRLWPRKESKPQEVSTH